MNKQIIIFDTTLRDGDQSLQISLNTTKKLQIALALEKLGVDVIEVGFPVSSPGDFKSVQIIANELKDSCICALARCVDKDIDIAAEALRLAKNFRIHIFLATSGLHVKYKLRKNFSQIIEMAVHSIKYARRYTDNIEFSCEDAGRTTMDHLCLIVEAAINAGAKTINIPDTVGYTLPIEFGKIIDGLFKSVSNIDKAVISVHCHNDLGMAVGNSITAIQYGARQVEGTLNGIGERAGNTALEEIIMAIKVRHDLLGLHTNIKHCEIYSASQTVSKLCNLPIPANKAIVGANAFSHSSGIHQDGVLKHRQNYEIIIPESIGFAEEIEFNLTSRSGRAAVRHRMQLMGYQDNDYDMDRLYDVFLKLADKKGQVFDYDLESLAFINSAKQQLDFFCLKHFNLQFCYKNVFVLLIELLCGKKIHSYTIENTKLVNAIYDGLVYITGILFVLKKYQLIADSCFCSNDILGKVDVVLEYQGRQFHGTSLSANVIESSINSMINALNSIWRSCQVSKKFKVSQQ